MVHRRQKVIPIWGACRDSRRGEIPVPIPNGMDTIVVDTVIREGEDKGGAKILESRGTKAFRYKLRTQQY